MYVMMEKDGQQFPADDEADALKAESKGWKRVQPPAPVPEYLAKPTPSAPPKAPTMTMYEKDGTAKEVPVEQSVDFLKKTGHKVDDPVYVPISQGESAIRGALQGATLGWGDELSAQAEGLIPRGLSEFVNPDVLKGLPENATRAEKVAKALEYYRNRNKQAQSDNAKTYLAGELAGGLAAPMPGAGAAKAVGLGAKVVKGAKAGAGVGAIAGAGMSDKSLTEDPLGVIEDAAGGAVGGATFGAGLPALGALGSAIAATAPAQKVKRVLDAVATPIVDPIKDAAARMAVRAIGLSKAGYNKLGRQDVTAGKESAEAIGRMLLDPTRKLYTEESLGVPPESALAKFVRDVKRNASDATPEVPDDAEKVGDVLFGLHTEAAKNRASDVVERSTIGKVLGPLTSPDTALERIQANKQAVGRQVGDILERLDSGIQGREHLQHSLTGQAVPGIAAAFPRSMVTNPLAPVMQRKPASMFPQTAFDVEAVAQKVMSRAEELKDSPIMANQALGEELEKQLWSLIGKSPGNGLMSLKDGHKLRVELDRVIYHNDKDPTRSLFGEELKGLRDAISEELQTKVQAAAKELGVPPTWKKFTDLYSNLTKAEDIASEGVKKLYGNSILGIREQGGGLGGGGLGAFLGHSVGGPVGAAAGAGLGWASGALLGGVNRRYGPQLGATSLDALATLLAKPATRAGDVAKKLAESPAAAGNLGAEARKALLDAWLKKKEGK